MPVLQIRKENWRSDRVDSRGIISECVAEEITDVPVPRRRTRDSHAQGFLVERSWNPQRRTGPIWVMKMIRTSLKSCRLSSLLKGTPSTSRRHERREGDKDCRRCYPSRPKPTTRVLDRGSVFGGTCQYRLSSAAVQQMRVGALSPMPSCLGTGGPGKDTPSTLGLEQQGGCGRPTWIRQLIHGKHDSGVGC